MEWTVSIFDKQNQRILVKFDPMNDIIHFIGQYKPHNKPWIDFSEEQHPIDIDLDTIKDLLVKTYDKMKLRLDIYNNVAEGFNYIKEIEIKE